MVRGHQHPSGSSPAGSPTSIRFSSGVLTNITIKISSGATNIHQVFASGFLLHYNPSLRFASGAINKIDQLLLEIHMDPNGLAMQMHTVSVLASKSNVFWSQRNQYAPGAVSGTQLHSVWEIGWWNKQWIDQFFGRIRRRLGAVVQNFAGFWG